MPLDLPGLRELERKKVPEKRTLGIRAERTERPAGCPHRSCRSNLLALGPMLKPKDSKHIKFMDLPQPPLTVAVYVKRRRWTCPHCGRTFAETVPNMDEKRYMTKRLLAYIEDRALEVPFTHLANEVGVHENVIRDVVHDMSKRADKGRRIEAPRVLGLDEVFVKRGTGKVRKKIGYGVITDVGRKLPVEILQSRKKGIVIRALKKLDLSHVEAATIDMTDSYRDALHTVFGPDFPVVVDHFHVVRAANAGMEFAWNGPWRTTKKGSPERKRFNQAKHLWRRRADSLTEKDLERLKEWHERFPELLDAFEVKEAFYRLWELPDEATADGAMTAWLECLTPEQERWFDGCVYAVTEWREEILNYYRTGKKVSNAYTESFNRKVQSMSREGRGYTFEVLRYRLLHAKDRRDEPVLHDRDDFWRLHDGHVSEEVRNSLFPGTNMTVSTFFERLAAKAQGR